MRGMNRGVVLIVGGLAILAIVVTALVLVVRGATHSETETEAPPDPVPTGTVESNEPSPTKTESQASPVDEATATAEDFVAAFNEQRYDDETPNTWFYETKAVTTADYYAVLTDGIDPTVGGSSVAQNDAQQIRTSVDITDTIAEEDSKTQIRVYVSYDIKTASSTSSSTAQASTVVKVVNEGGEWLADDSGQTEDLMEGFFADHTD